MIQEAVEMELQASLDRLKVDMASQTKRIAETEQRISNVEDEHLEHLVRIQTLETNLTLMAEKLDDLKDRSRGNNLRIMGIPESIKTADLFRICKQDIPKALRIDKDCTAEGAHQLGALQPDRKGPKQVIVKYPSNSNKSAILQKF